MDRKYTQFLKPKDGCDDDFYFENVEIEKGDGYLIKDLLIFQRKYI